MYEHIHKQITKPCQTCKKRKFPEKMKKVEKRYYCGNICYWRRKE